MAAIDELRKRLREMRSRFEEWNEGYERAYQRLRRERLGRWRKPDATVEAELRDQAIRAAGDEVPRAMSGFLEELTAAYLVEPLPHNRAKLRADCGGSEALLGALWSYAEHGAERIEGGEDGDRLERSLAALSLDDARTNFEQVDALLARLWLAAARAGIDARAAFAKVAAVSNPGMGGGGACTAQRLTEFESSLTFKRVIAPQLLGRSA